MTTSNQPNSYGAMSRTELEALEITLVQKYDEIAAAKLALDLTRGKPSSEQLNLSNELDGILKGQYILQDGTDVRNYGGLLGLSLIHI